MIKSFQIKLVPHLPAMGRGVTAVELQNITGLLIRRIHRARVSRTGRDIPAYINNTAIGADPQNIQIKLHIFHPELINIILFENKQHALDPLVQTCAVHQPALQISLLWRPPPPPRNYPDGKPGEPMYPHVQCWRKETEKKDK